MKDGGGHSRCHPRVNMRHMTDVFFFGAKMVRIYTVIYPLTNRNLKPKIKKQNIVKIGRK